MAFFFCVLSFFQSGHRNWEPATVSDTVGDLVLLYLNGCGVDGVGYVTFWGESSSSSSIRSSDVRDPYNEIMIQLYTGICVVLQGLLLGSVRL